MKEITDIIAAYQETVRNGQQSALATVVKVEGSSYRREGARMLIADNGKLTGAISGGCLEGDALCKALLVMQQQQPLLVTYDTMDEEDAKLGMQLGCNGIVHILIEPVNDIHNPVTLLCATAKKRQNAVLATMFSMSDRRNPQSGTCLSFSDEGYVKPDKNLLLDKRIIQDAEQALQLQTSFTKNYPDEKETTVFFHFIPPPLSVIIFGAGNDAMPLVSMASLLGWETTIVDGRPMYATSRRFALANQVYVAKPDEAVSSLQFDNQTAAVLMTHNYNYDKAVLKQLLPLGLSYVGLLGPKRKFRRILDEIKSENKVLNEYELSNVYGPAGFDIGAETAEEIALAIIAEIKAVFTNRAGTSLRKKVLPIHTDDGQ